jgi:hypothetical protein
MKLNMDYLQYHQKSESQMTGNNYNKRNRSSKEKIKDVYGVSCTYK